MEHGRQILDYEPVSQDAREMQRALRRVVISLSVTVIVNASLVFSLTRDSSLLTIAAGFFAVPVLNLIFAALSVEALTITGRLAPRTIAMFFALAAFLFPLLAIFLDLGAAIFFGFRGWI